MNLLLEAFTRVLTATLEGSVALLLILAVLEIFRRRIRIRIRHALWLIVLVRLLLPAFPSSPVSIFEVAGIDFTRILSLHHSYEENDPSQQSLLPLIAPPVQHNAAGQESGLEPVEEGQPGLSSPPAPKEKTPAALQILALVWLTGLVGLSAGMARHLFYTSRGFKWLEPVKDPALLEILEECKQRLGITRPVLLYTGSRRAEGPYIFGILRPRIYVPDVLCRELSQAQLRHILTHELAHLKRCDMLWGLLGGIALAVHWMNPLVWLGMKQMKAEREMACDACALDALGEEEALPYGMTIIETLKRFAFRKGRPPVLGFHSEDAGKQLKRRIYMIAGYKKGSYRLTAASILCVLALCAGTLTSASAPAQPVPEGRTASLMTAAAENRILFERKDGSRTYDNLNKASQVSDFAFKAPTELPEGYRLESVILRRTPSSGEKRYAANMRFEQLEADTGRVMDNFNLAAKYGSDGMDQAYDHIVENEKKQTDSLDKGFLHVKENETIEGVDVWKMTITRDNKTFVYHIWQDEGVQYQIGPFSLKAPSFAESLIRSMKKAPFPFEQQYNGRLQNAPVYDTDDLSRAGQAIGIPLKLPLQLLSSFEAGDAKVMRKSNFGFPVDLQDRNTLLLSVAYVKQGDTVQSFSLMQVKKNGIWEELQSSGQASFMQIDGKKFTEPVYALTLEGKKVYRTGAYKIDGAINTPDEPDFISYYWTEEEACFQVRFRGDRGKEMDEIVSAIIREEPNVEL